MISLESLKEKDCFIEERPQTFGSPMELSDVEIQQLKDHNQKRIRRVIAIVAIAMTVISMVLVALSLSLGKDIDRLVEQSMEKRNLNTNDFLNFNRNTSEW